MTKREMKTSERSDERLALVNKLDAASLLLKEASEMWSKLSPEESYATGLCYPAYMPSFDVFVSDMDFWLNHLCNEDM